MDDAEKQWAHYRAQRGAILEDFGLKLAIRRGPEESQERLSERALLHRNSVGLLERGEREPGLLTLLLLAKTFNITVNDLIAGLPVPTVKRPRA
jgi:transcriptional regulator with XRE-family HTH domain